MKSLGAEKITIMGLLLVFLVSLLSIGPALAQKKIELTFWNIAVENERAVYEQAIERFEEDNPNVNVKMTSLQNDPYKDKLKVAAGAGNLPDIWKSWGGGILQQYVDANKVADITGLLNETGFIETFPSSTFDLVTYDDNIYGIPYGGLAGVVVWYNEAIFEEYDIEVPETWAELESVAKKLSSRGVIPFVLANKSSWPGTEWYEYLVLRLAGKDKIVKTLENQEGHSMTDEPFVKAGRMIQDFIKKGYFNKGYSSLSYDLGGSRRLLYSGLAAMEVMGSWEYSVALGENEDWAKEKMGFFNFPMVEGGEGDPSSLVGSAGQDYLHITQGLSQEKKEAAFELLQYIMDEESLQEWVDIGTVVPVKGAKDMFDDPMLADLYSLFSSAKNVQQYWDQALPPALAEEHKTQCTLLLNLDITPEQYGKRMEKAIEKYYED